MELCSLHPFETSFISTFVASATDEAGAATPARRGLARLRDGDERGAYDLGHALGTALSIEHPVFTHAGVSLTTWEARIDRGVGMLLRPPARLLIDAGLDPAIARLLPIRLEPSRGMMGGAFIPARLIPELRQQIDTRLERSVRRLIDAEMDPYGAIGALWLAAAYAEEHGCGLFEAIDVVTPEGYVPSMPEARVVMPDRRTLDRALRTRVEAAAKPPKQPSVWRRWRDRGHQSDPGEQKGT